VIQNIKAKILSFLQKKSPLLIKEILRIYKIYLFFFRGNEKKELVSLLTQSRVGAQHLFKAYSHPKRTVWTTMFVPSEILFAMGLYPFCLEIGAALFAGVGQSSKGLMVSESHDVSTDICSFHRAAIGHAYRNVFPKNILQIATTTLCDNNTKLTKLCGTITGKDTIFLDVPFEEDDFSIEYFTQQLKDMVKQLEAKTGRKMKQKSLEQAIEYANLTREKIIEVNELRKDPFCPLPGSRALGFMFQTYFLSGSKLSLEFYTHLAHELRKKTLENKKNAQITPEHQIRILWLELKPYFNVDFLQDLEEKQGVKIVFEETNHVYWDRIDPKAPYEGLARKHIVNTYNGPLERRIAVVKRLVKEYQVDGVVTFSSWGCRRNNAAIPTVKKELNNIGYPFLNLDGDCIDENNYMPGQFSTRIEGFLEMLRSKKANVSPQRETCSV